MKKFLRKKRLVHACLYFFGGLFRLVAALINMASNYLFQYASPMEPQV